MSNEDWERRFRDAYDRARDAYESGAGTPEDCVDADDIAFLAGIGCSAQELFDLVEDDVSMGEPGWEMALRITAVRREWFLETEDGARGTERIRHISEFPSPGATLGGIAWLPRLIAKARAKLRGELPPELMYACGGDRHFLRDRGLEADGFLRAVWRAGDDTAQILEYVRRRGCL